MLGLYLGARERGSGEAEAIQSVASGYDEDAATVLETLAEHARSPREATARRRAGTLLVWLESYVPRLSVAQLIENCN